MLRNLIENPENTLILTANQRLAIALKQEYDVSQQNLALASWPTLHIMTLNQWLPQLWQTLSTIELCLNMNQELALWEKIISCSHKNILPQPTAQLARQAWHLLQHWRLPLTSIKNFANENTAAFLAWAEQFIVSCQRSCWLDDASCLAAIIDRLPNQTNMLPQNIILAGFKFTTPLIDHFFNTLKMYSNVVHYHSEQQIAEITKVEFAEQTHEIETMARWAKQYINDNPKNIIACVVPNLAELRKKIDETFTEIFIPQASLPSYPVFTVPYNIAGGIKFSDYPLIASALQILQLAQKKFGFQQICQVLNSPFIYVGLSELPLRAILQNTLADLGEQDLDLRAILASARNLAKHQQIPAKKFLFIDCLIQAIALTSTFGSSATVLEWLELFGKFLAIFGWPGERKLTSEEYQLLQRWQILLEEFAELSLIHSILSFKEAYQALIKLCENTLFQAQTPIQPIQILTPLDTIGFVFDTVWIMSMNEETWPSPPSPNPFIPNSLQRKLAMPHASAQQELIYARELTGYLAKCAKKVIFSYASSTDNKSQKASNLLAEYSTFNHTELNLPKLISFPQTIQESAIVEEFIDEIAPVVTNEEIIQGGTYIFRLQAACPFRAFAEIRLKAKPLSRINLGLNAKQRGSLLHNVLAQVWHILKDQQTLNTLTNDQLIATIDVAIKKTLLPLKKSKPSIVKTNFAEIERLRLHRLLQIWMDLEKQREPFKVIACEQKRTITLAGKTIQIQIDRIDQLSDDSQIIIDYKTGQANINDWFGERPEEPQLPLYYISHQTAISGLLFGQIRSNEIGFKGITNETHFINGVKTPAQLHNANIAEDWLTIENNWRIILEKLANDFYQGKASVDPKDQRRNCQVCHLATLCRVHEKHAIVN